MSAAAVRTPTQNRAIHAALQELHRRSGVELHELRANVLTTTCRKVSGQEHSSRLTTDQANRVLALLNQEVAKYSPPTPAAPASPAPHKPWGKRQDARRNEAGITRFQQQVILGLYEMLGFDQAARRRFCERQTGGKPWPQTQQHADAIITPLTEMALRKLTWRDAKARFEALGDVKLDEWKTSFVADVLRQLAGDRPDKVMSAHKLKKLIECEAAAATARLSEGA